MLDMTSWLSSFYLPILELDGCGATKDRNGNAQLTAFWINLFHDTVLILEWSIGNLNGLADFK